MSEDRTTRDGAASVEELADARSETDEMAQVVERLQPRLTQLPTADLEARVRSAWESFAGAPVRTFIPILVERAVQRQAVA